MVKYQRAGITIRENIVFTKYNIVNEMFLNSTKLGNKLYGKEVQLDFEYTGT